MLHTKVESSIISLYAYQEKLAKYHKPVNYLDEYRFFIVFIATLLSVFRPFPNVSYIR